MKRLLPLIGIIAVILFIAYYETTYSIEDGANNELYNYPQIPVVNDSSENEEVSASASIETADPLEGLTPELELRYESETIEEGYLVETHRQYEIYRDQNNQVVKSIPTDHIEYIKYKME
ncbi:hypothetical protein [Bacillus mesophilum]|uniref:Uncharacterized protein n=1 Tax=Bacillus mesophilum TaxID=1071718 RepID=A0A7V7UTM3_9BACI|nr:hypothetical protein [Bacillus mesophilum]KAB2330622.1 hypothetical protein F7732_18410 [Bacillus mesophilum]